MAHLPAFEKELAEFGFLPARDLSIEYH